MAQPQGEGQRLGHWSLLIWAWLIPARLAPANWWNNETQLDELAFPRSCQLRSLCKNISRLNLRVGLHPSPSCPDLHGRVNRFLCPVCLAGGRGEGGLKVHHLASLTWPLPSMEAHGGKG
ncbi:unnamed protein product [Nyctereutes procyonoides]|uniref:(raccoon dog) hypothetical protein n=1 Tax=Nyctereutes procyonoides TaxID=34880 RepID=A0A811YG15_NYCPR|nr:unnamed protein product [Nyctereutes procyonoides]